MYLKKNHIIVFLILQMLFIMIAFPYLIGLNAFAPKSYLSSGTFSAASLAESSFSTRDAFGQRDYFDQERVFLRFYRDSIRKGELPFWNELTFGGVSQEDSMVFSYLSPFHLPWIIVDNDHIAKGIQILLLLNFGALAFLWWCRILKIPGNFSLLVVIFGTLTPLALHFLAHVHQPAIYYCGLLIFASYHRYFETGASKHLILFYLLLILAITINFISIFLFISIGLTFLAGAYLIHSADHQKAIIKRIITSIFAYFFAIGTMSFFLGPILLEAHLVRDPITPKYMSLSPFSSAYKMLDSLLFSRLSDGVWLPFLYLIPFLLLLFWKRKSLHKIPIVILGIIYFWIFCVVVTGITPIQVVFRTYVPGMMYSNNALFRMLYFCNLCALLPLFWMLSNIPYNKSNQTSSKEGALILNVSSVFLLGVGFLNLFLWLIAIFPSPISSFNQRKINTMMNLLTRSENYWALGFSALIAGLLFFCWYSWRKGRWGHSSALFYILVFLVGVCYIMIFQFQRPNFPIDKDPVNHAIFDGIEKGENTLTLENCSLKSHSWYRSEATLAGFRTYDGSVDVGLPSSVRKFWAPLNDIDQLNGSGFDIMETFWICAERIVRQDKTLIMSYKRLLQAIGVRYIFSDRIIKDKNVRLINQIGKLKVYELSNRWSTVSFFPGEAAETIRDMFRGLVKEEKQAIDLFERLNIIRQNLPVSKESNLRWSIGPVFENQKVSGVIYMNHLNEYYRKPKWPLLDLPLEGKWQLVKNDIILDFPLSDIPFRIIGTTVDNSPIIIQYSMSQYRVWLTLSIAALIGFIGIIFFHRMNSLNV